LRLLEIGVIGLVVLLGLVEVDHERFDTLRAACLIGHDNVTGRRGRGRVAGGSLCAELIVSIRRGS